MYYDRHQDLDHMLRSSEARKKLEDNPWCISLMKIDTLIECLYARGFYCAKELEVDSLWLTK
ncbi:hypothetical protein PR048_015824 [Dryococelus australis]|uniref:Uncharacterized protein n=1 Tax=Dryococelus australis TaxID=614101 RepID=A0ABQ9HI23_9NEOP|nr:hypothetical protein PR048_015824 [Dryococelus australis]